MSLASDLNQKIAQFGADADKAHTITHGDINTVVPTEGGDVNSLARTMKQIRDGAEDVYDEIRATQTVTAAWVNSAFSPFDSAVFTNGKPSAFSHNGSSGPAKLLLALPTDAYRVRVQFKAADGTLSWPCPPGMAPRLVLMDENENTTLKDMPGSALWTGGSQVKPGVELDTSCIAPAGTKYLALWFDTSDEALGGAQVDSMDYASGFESIVVTSGSSVSLIRLSEAIDTAETAVNDAIVAKNATEQAKTSAQANAATIAGLVAPAQADRAAVATAKQDSQTDRGVIARYKTDAFADKEAASDSAGNAADYEAAAELSKNNAQQSAENADGFRNDAQVSAAAAAAAELAAGNADKLGKGDARVQALGGVALEGNGGDVPGYGHALVSGQIPSEFEMVFWCRRKAGADERNRMLAAFTTTGGSYTMTFGHPTYGSGLWGIGFNDTLVTFGGLQTDFHVVSYGRDSVGWFVSCDGVLDRSAFGVTGTPVSIDRIFGGTFGGYGQFAGDVSRSILFNFALSESQRAKLILNEPGAEVITRAGFATADTWAGAYNYALSSVTATGFTADYTGGFSFAHPTGFRYYGGTTPLQDGTKIRISCHVVLNAGDPLALPGAVLYDGQSFIDQQQLSPGENVAVLTCRNRAWVIFSNHPGVFGDHGNSNFTISNIKMEILGASGRWEPLNWTSLGRGLDSSGNGNDIIPYGKGVTPLNPQPVQNRRASWSYDHINGFSRFDTILSHAQPFKLAAGVLKIPFPAFVPSTNYEVPSVMAYEAESTTPSYGQPYVMTSIDGTNGVVITRLLSSLSANFDCPVSGASEWRE